MMCMTVCIAYLELEPGAQLLLPDLQGAHLAGQSHDGGVQTLVLLLKTNKQTIHSP